MSEPIVHQLSFDAEPERIFRALMTSEQHAAFTGGPAEISDQVGGSFWCHGGSILGRNLDLVDNQRIVQAWRVAAWPEGTYSIVRFDLSPEGKGTRLTLTHSGVPVAAREQISKGWEMRYWEPLKGWLQR